MGDRRDDTKNARRDINVAAGIKHAPDSFYSRLSLTTDFLPVYYYDLIPRNDGFQHDDSVPVCERARIRGNAPVDVL
jgi:hypothetical protein